MNESLQAALTRVKSSKATLPAVICALAVVAVLATIMAFRGPAGQQFVGSWRVPDPVTGGTWTVRISRTSDGFALQVPMSNVAPIPYRFKGGKLVPAPGYESGSIISLVGHKLVLTPPDTPAVTPKSRATHATAPIATAQPTTTAQPTASGSPDPNAQQNDQITAGIHTLQAAVQSWAADHQDLYPTPDLVVSSGGFAAYVQTVGSWPVNPVTGQPMKPGTGAGDYAYEQVDGGQGFTLTGYGVDGTSLITVP